MFRFLDCDERTGSKACSAGSDFDGNNEGESSNEEESDDMGGSSDAASKESSESESGGGMKRQCALKICALNVDGNLND